MSSKGTAHQTTNYTLSAFNIYDPVPSKGPDQESVNHYLRWAVKYKHWRVLSVKLTADFVNTTPHPCFVGISCHADSIVKSDDLENVMASPLSKYKILNGANGGSTKTRMTWNLNWKQVTVLGDGGLNAASKTGSYYKNALGNWVTSVPNRAAWIVPWICDLDGTDMQVQCSLRMDYKVSWQVPHPITRYSTDVSNVECLIPDEIKYGVEAPGGIHPSLPAASPWTYPQGVHSAICEDDPDNVVISNPPPP